MARRDEIELPENSLMLKCNPDMTCEKLIEKLKEVTGIADLCVYRLGY